MRTRLPALRIAALQHEAHAELAADLLHLHRLALVGERRVAGDHEQARDLRQVGDHVLGDAVAEILLLGIAAHIGERQHGDRGLVRHRRARPARATPLARPMRNTRTGRAMFFTGFSPRSSSSMPSLSRTESRTARETKMRARLGEPFQAGGDVDAVAEDVVVLDDDVAEVDADAELDARLVGRAAVAVGHAGLDGDGAAHRLDGAGEIDQQAIAGALDDAAAVGGDMRARSARRGAPFSRCSVPSSSRLISRL